MGDVQATTDSCKITTEVLNGLMGQVDRFILNSTVTLTFPQNHLFLCRWSRTAFSTKRRLDAELIAMHQPLNFTKISLHLTSKALPVMMCQKSTESCYDTKCTMYIVHMTTCVIFCDESPTPWWLSRRWWWWSIYRVVVSAIMSTNDQPDELGGTHVSGTGWMYEGPNNEINKEVF